MNNRSANLSYRNYAGYHKPLKSKKKKFPLAKLITIVLLVAVIFAVPTYAYVHNKPTDPKSTPKTTVLKSSSNTPIVKTQSTACAGNTLSKLIVASISQRHLWVCQGSQIVYQTPVITGDMNVIADATPVGTYKIYAKETKVYLTGSDSRGSWNDFVNYWMPFLDNQYGVFGLHDATWRTASDFGSISPYSNNASHGCIELPLSAGEWIYNWSTIGTPVTIES